MCIDYDSLTPSMKQFMDIKKQYPEYLLFYRMGDFYELFFDDAKIASQVLSLTLTRRNKSEKSDIPMCGVPFHAYEQYLETLIKQGYKVAICEQMETPEEAKKRGAKALVRRDVIRLVTAGTLTEDNILKSHQNNYLLCCVKYFDTLGFAWIDMSTGDFYTRQTEIKNNKIASDLQSFISVIEPSEIIIPDSFRKIKELMDFISFYQDKLTVLPSERFHVTNMQKFLEKAYHVSTLEAFGNFSKAEISAAGVILDYLDNTQKGKMPRLKVPLHFNTSQFMEIDSATRSNLELLKTTKGEREHSLLSTIDKTVTGCGGRLLSSRIRMPSIHIAEINRRLDLIDFFVHIPDLKDDIRTLLKESSDLERSVSRLSVERGGPRDIAEIGQTLSLIPKIKKLITNFGRYDKLVEKLPEAMENLLQKFGDFSNLQNRIQSALKETRELPAHTRDGGFIRSGYDAVLDEINDTKNHKEKILHELELKYTQETGVTGLKIKYNNLIGYYIDIPAKYTKEILQNPKFIHRQSVLNSGRFTTMELSEVERSIFGAADKALAKELVLFDELALSILSASNKISQAAEVFAELDSASALADLALEKNYTRPILDQSMDFEVKNGRHPVVEAALNGTHENSFVSNDCHLDQTNKVWLLTGPNMAGKSTFLRQNAIIGIMAQAGCFVPCSYAKIGVIDKIFSRVGASDDLSRGRSTFMVEMVETASIVNQATERSFVIVDEIGRGTATYDGLSIAWAVVEHLHEVNRCRSLFATHYHELTVLSSKLKNLSLHCMKIKEFNDEVIFMHEVINGMADRSYGIHVAKLAGLPNLVIKRATQVLHSLETNPNNRKISGIEDDLPLFSVFKQQEISKPTPKTSPLEEALEKINPDALSPREALETVYALKALCSSKK